MKVEFKNGKMIITGREFRKAHKNKEMMHDLMMATECFTAPQCFEYCMSEEEYECYYPLIPENSKVIFEIKESSIFDSIWVEIAIMKNNKIQKIRWSEDDGKSYTYLRLID